MLFIHRSKTIVSSFPITKVGIKQVFFAETFVLSTYSSLYHLGNDYRCVFPREAIPGFSLGHLYSARSR